MKTPYSRLTAFALMFVIAGCNAEKVAADKPAAASVATAGDVAFVGVSVIDTEHGETIANQTVVVSNGKIVDIVGADEAVLAGGVTKIDGAGKFLAPGLTEMHAHAINPDDLTLYLAHGVTLVRNLWGQADALELQAAIERGDILAPRYVTAGPIVDGTPRIFAAMTEMVDPADADAFVKAYKEAGYDFLKPYSRLKPEVFEAIVAAAKKYDLEVSGHIPYALDLNDAINAGMRTSEHFMGVMPAILADESLANPDLASVPGQTDAQGVAVALGKGQISNESLIDRDKLKALAERTAAADHWFVPTVAVMKNFTPEPYEGDPAWNRYQTPGTQALLAMADAMGGDWWPGPDGLDEGEEILFDLRAEAMRAMRDAGAKFLTGTDNSVYHGFGVVDELQAMHNIGFTNAEVMKAATYEAGNYLGMAGEYGVVAEGAAADLILVDANPLENLDALRDLSGVMLRGVWHPAQELDAMLEAVADKHAAVIAKFDGAPSLSGAMGATADFVGPDGAALRIAGADEEGTKIISLAAPTGGDWRTASVRFAGDNVVVMKEGEETARIEQSAEGWRMGEGENASADRAVVLTGGPADILLLNAAAGGILDDGETVSLAVWNCGPDLDCAGVSPERATLAGRGRDVIKGYFGYEDSYLHALVMAGEEALAVRYWMSPPSAFGGGPIALESDRLSVGRRIR